MTNAILNLDEAMKQQPRNNAWWDAVLARDAAQDGVFYFGVSSTGVYCRPSCPARRPKRENVTFFRYADEAERAGFRACLRCRPRAAAGDPMAARVKEICRYIEQHLDEPLSLARLAKEFKLSPFHLQRTVKAALGITPRQYADACRMQRFKSRLQEGAAVTTAIYDAGYSSSSRLYERAAGQLGMKADTYRRGAIGVPLRYTMMDSPAGRVLIGATQKGVCTIRMGASDAELEHGLRREFPFAFRKRDDAGMAEHRTALAKYFQGKTANPQLPLDIQATSFQRRVWEHLQNIAPGKTESYSQVAVALGQPTATRAVARACATNPVALAIPCHRVVGRDGKLTGYRWGVERKRKLLEMEARRAAAAVR
jgi:AraC family transcriptional regulator, regulatory protein of adaptative response / methylated-DNA-[protein]-cysteine methyltransferase